MLGWIADAAPWGREQVLEIKGLGHTYADGHRAIDSVDLSVARGELVSLVGPSGCGKSTLLRCVAGLVRPTEGAVVVNGEPVSDIPSDLRWSSRTTRAPSSPG
ncbi:ATP-binding cassette domain-containing protein [Streptomyces sp. LHD-70]|uniref:ATP-binding cassette domain-containing protein n=1 Tax=Streptomyces sp. LHD-70 TaxID=3072140 RepID=UPI0028100748|nr:ATP-binding cassette domain-containing protein [Streptomyces sp. LHD-70]MDQ8700917.1 ATP-binding cassette domain-containing protein [Streptomyces sp. LHD-70]